MQEVLNRWLSAKDCCRKQRELPSAPVGRHRADGTKYKDW